MTQNFIRIAQGACRYCIALRGDAYWFLVNLLSVFIQHACSAHGVTGEVSPGDWLGMWCHSDQLQCIKWLTHLCAVFLFDSWKCSAMESRLYRYRACFICEAYLVILVSRHIWPNTVLVRLVNLSCAS